MNKLKLNVGEILNLKKLFYYIDKVDECLDDLVNKELDKVEKKHINDINESNNELEEIKDIIRKLEDYKCVTRTGYSSHLLGYLKLQDDLKKLYIKYNKDNCLKNKYYDNFDLNRKYKLFEVKYLFFKDYYSILNKEIEYFKETILGKENDIYGECGFDEEYQNYLAMSVFYEYLDKNNFDTLEDIYNLYKKEFGFIIKESKDTICKFSDNKLEQDYDNIDLLKINDILKDINSCIINYESTLDDLICLVIKLQKELYKVIKPKDLNDDKELEVINYFKTTGIEEYYNKKISSDIKNKYK